MAMVFALLATSFVDAQKASNGSCGEHRHLVTRQAKCKTDKNAKTKCTPPKTVCKWDKGYNPKAVATSTDASKNIIRIDTDRSIRHSNFSFFNKNKKWIKDSILRLDARGELQRVEELNKAEEFKKYAEELQKDTTKATDVSSGGIFVEIPKNAAFISCNYHFKTSPRVFIALDMEPIDPTKSYSLTSPNPIKDYADVSLRISGKDLWLLTPIDSDSSDDSQPIMGGSSSTYAPQAFTPAAPYNAAGLVGNYFSGNSIATIYDPSGQTDESYTFTDIQAISQSIRAQGVLIGTMPTPGFVQSAASCSGCKTATTRLYGTLVPEDDAA